MSSLLIQGGFVLDVHRVSEDPQNDSPTIADVLITDGVIAQVAPRITPPEGARVIDATGKLVSPGLVDTHLHMWQTPLRGMTHHLWAKEYFHTVHPMSQYYTPEDMYWATYAGGLELLSHGVTQVFDYCHSANSPEHVDASLQGHRDSGIRATYGFGLFERESSTYRDRAHRLDDLGRIADETKSDSLVDVAVAIDHAYDATAVSRARELGVGISVHGNPIGLLQDFADDHALGPDVLWTHGNASSESELAALAEAGAYLSLTPDIEMGMGKPVHIFDHAVRHGINVVLGVDVVSYAAGDMLTQMHLAYALCRVLNGMTERDKGHVPPRRDVRVPGVSTGEITRWATSAGQAAIAGARPLPATGLSVGAPGDVILIETEPFGLAMGDPTGHLVQQATSRDVAATIVAGRVVYDSGRLTGDHDLEAVSQNLRLTRQRLLATRDLGLSAK